ncbi:NUDIX hydrolase [soil metagenome]
MLFTRDHCVSTEQVWEGAIINLRVDTVTVDNTVATREVVEHNGGVVIAGLTSANKVILVKQYRYSIDHELIELPAGRIEAGEDPFPAAQRELTEETGYLAENWQELSRMYTAPGFCNEMIYIYLAENLTYQGKNLDFDEETEVIELSLDEAWAMVFNGQIQDAKTIAGLGLLSQRQAK